MAGLATYTDTRMSIHPPASPTRRPEVVEQAAATRTLEEGSVGWKFGHIKDDDDDDSLEEEELS